MEKRLTMFLACLFLSMGVALAQMKVSGTVTTSDGEPVIGASVKVVGTGTGTVTDLEGNFSLTVPSGKSQLEVSYLGLQTKTVKAAARLDIVLEYDETALDEVVVTGYGTGKKLGTISGSVATVGNSTLEKAVTPNFTDALAGQVAGLSVLSSSGDPSKSASIRIRGVNSIYSSNAPLFILDGAPISSSMFNTLNPSDIQNITVLKDASSTAVYGSRAANGVIVITSRKGRYNERANLTLRAQYGISSPVEDGITMMNSQQYMQFRELIGQPLSNEVKSLINDYGFDTNWRDEILNDAAPTYTLDATMTGGGQNINYYISFNHHSQDGIVDQSGMHRETLRANIDAKLNNWFKVGLQSNFGTNSYMTNNEAESTSGIYSSNPMVFSRSALPFEVPYYYSFDAEGKLIKGDRADVLPYSGLYTPYFVNKNREVKRKRVTVNFNIYEQLTPIEGLTFRAQQAMDGYDLTLSNTGKPYEAFTTPLGTAVESRDGYAQDSFTRYYSYTLTHTGEYKHTWGAHSFTGLVGEETIITKSRGFGLFTEGQTDARQLRLTDAPQAIPVGNLSDSRYEETFNSVFVTASYNYLEKYFLDLSYRTDGSSRFAPGHRWGNFWSVGAMWNAKKEDFLKNVNWLNEWEVRASYGSTGNASGAGSYDYFGLYGAGSPYNGTSSLGISQPSNPELTWERVAQLNIGTSFRVLDRLGIDFDFYRKKTTDMLMSIPYSYTTGYASGIGNIGDMTNTGFDVTANVDILKTQDITWTFKANVNYNKNRINDLFAGRDFYTLGDYGLRLETGHAFGEFYYVKYAGVDPRDGKPQWYDKNGNLTKNYSTDDAVFLGKNMYAPWTGGFGTTFQWKGLSVSADFQWQADKYLINNDTWFVSNPSKFGTTDNQSVEMLNVWTHPGQITDIPAYGEQMQADDHMVENASFLRLKNLTVQYIFPRSLVQKLGVLQQIKVFGIARNLFTITSFSGYDPEPDSNLVQYNYPNTRQLVLGMELTF